MVYWRVTFRAVQGILLDAGSIRRELVVNKNSLAQPPQVALSVKTAPTQQSAILAGLQEETHLLKIISSDTEFSIPSSTCLHVRLHRRPHRRYQSHSSPLPHALDEGSRRLVASVAVAGKGVEELARRPHLYLPQQPRHLNLCLHRHTATFRVLVR